MAPFNKILYEVLSNEGLIGRDHVACIRNDNSGKVSVVAIPASDVIVARELVVVAVNFARLQVKHLAFRKVDLFYPLELAAYTIFHVVVAHVNQDGETTLEKFCVDLSSVVLAILDF